VKTIDITASGDPAIAKATVEQFLLGQGYAIVRIDDWSNTAEKGISGSTRTVRKKDTYYKVSLSVMSGVPGQYTLRIKQLNSGLERGPFGRPRVTEKFLALVQEIGQVLSGVGAVISSVEV
jgi:hypothetical protein